MKSRKLSWTSTYWNIGITIWKRVLYVNWKYRNHFSCVFQSIWFQKFSLDWRYSLVCPIVFKTFALKKMCKVEKCSKISMFCEFKHLLASRYLYLILELLDEVLFKEIKEVWRFFRNFLSTFIRSSFNTILFSSFCKQILLTDIYAWGISCVVLQVLSEIKYEII